MSNKKEKRSMIKRFSDFMFNPADLNKDKEKTNTLRALGDSFVISSGFGKNTQEYASSRERAAVAVIAREMKKTDVRHVRGGENTVPVKSNISRVLKDPNPVMTTSDLLEKTVMILYKNDNSYIYVKRDNNGKVLELWPLNPSSVEARERIIDGKKYITLYMEFRNDTKVELLYNDVIHIKRNFFENDIFGGDSNGNPDREGIDDIIEISKQVNTNMVNSTRSSINGIVKYDSMLSKDKIENSVKEFNDLLEKSESGILGLDVGATYHDLKRNVTSVDKEMIEYIDNMIAEYYGVPANIIRGDFTKSELESFIQATIEPLAVSFQQEFTRVLFTKAEIDKGNKIVFYFNRTIFMSVSEKLELARIFGDSGVATANEQRELMGMPPLEELDGVITMSKNYMNREDLDILNKLKKSESEEE